MLARAQIFVLSSRSEAFPRSVLEAMRAGLAVVASDVGGVAEALDNGRNGILVPRGDAQALAKALGALIKDADQRRRLGTAARLDYEARFRLEAMVERTAGIYDSVLRHATGEQQPDSELNRTGTIPRASTETEPFPELSAVKGLLRSDPQRVKRVFDVVFTLCLALAVLPLGVALALAIVLDSRAACSSRTRAWARAAGPFRIWKFRSMIAANEGLLARYLEQNPRVSRNGSSRTS